MGSSYPLTRITILVDNDVKDGLGLAPEHGFSALIERGPDRILFDTGQGPALIHNARALGISLRPLNLVVLSHGHYDHTGGLYEVAFLGGPLRVVAHPGALRQHFGQHDGEAGPRSIGIPFRRETIEEVGTTFHLTTEFEEIASGIWFSGQVPRLYENSRDGRLLTLKDERLVPDSIEDDGSLVIETKAGPVLLLGCAHAGLQNILEHFRDKLALQSIHAIIGGTHLGMLHPSRTDAAIETFERYRVQCIATAHCTGSRANAALRAHFGRRFTKAYAGAVFEF